MARINLLTRHSGESYGAVLQTYATCMVLQSLGHKVTIINLIGKERVKKYFSIHSIRAYPKYINFWKFKMMNYPQKTKLMTSIDSSKIPSADYTIVGSDQVWNSQITKQNKLAYFLYFASNTQRLSLASSFGKNVWEENDDYTAEVKKCLSGFKAVSVREHSGVAICKNVFGIEAECIIDPTIAWGDFTKFVSPNPKNQIAVFILNQGNSVFPTILSFLSEKMGLDIKILDYYKGGKYNYLKVSQRSPVRWMNELFNSKMVITDSFHGVAFSVLFKKQFVVLCADVKKFTRIGSLLELLGLDDRVVTDSADLANRFDAISKPIDYSRIEQVISSEREKYYQFIIRNING